MKDNLWMKRALELAYLGIGKVAPNPMVGCVIVHHHQIIGEGWHQFYGQAHAEVNAIADVQDKSLISLSTVYVTLEPCTHFGKTPPCVDLLLQYKPQKVVIAQTDINPLVAGKGIAKLREAGIEVNVGVMEKEAKILNKRFFTFFEKKRPFILLKWAETADGFIAKNDYDSKWISNSLSRKLVHQWRSEEASVMVGTNTALYDNPQLTVRDWSGKNPLRIVIDRKLRLPENLHLFDNQVSTICFNLLQDAQNGNIRWIKLPEQQFLENLFETLWQLKIQSVLIEGGSELLQNLLNLQLWDEIRVFKTSKIFGNGIASPTFKARLSHQTSILEDTLCYYTPF